MEAKKVKARCPNCGQLAQSTSKGQTGMFYRHRTKGQGLTHPFVVCFVPFRKGAKGG